MLIAYYFLLLKFKGFHIEAVEHSYRALELCQGSARRVHAAVPGVPAALAAPAVKRVAAKAPASCPVSPEPESA